MSDLTLRVWSGCILGAVFLAATVAGGIAFVILATLMACVIWLEWMQMKMPGSAAWLRSAGIVALVGAALVIVFAPASMVIAALAAIAAGFCGLMAGLGQQRAIGGFAYASALLVSLSLLRGEWGDMPGLIAIVFLVAVVWMTDIGAYFVGRSLGGPKLAPRLSPNKTISGACGGLLCALVAALVVHLVFGMVSLVTAIALAVFLSVLAQVGDLFESWMKRRSGVKDSGTVIPGHGGVMDRVDGLVFAAFGLWVAGAIKAGVTEPAQAFFIT